MLKIVLFFIFTDLIQIKEKMHVPVTARFPNHAFNENIYNEGVHLALPPHFFSIQVKSGACYITGQWVASSKQNKRNLIPTLTLTPKPIVFHNKICVFIMIFTALSFLRLIHGLSFI